MKSKDILAGIPKEGFLKVSREPAPELSDQERVALIRKGNEFFNQKKYELAKRIFLTVGYTDGLVRLGDYYYDQKMPLEAFRMYKVAPYKKRVEQMIEEMAGIIKKWLKEE
jgi:hypothetical protein